MLHTSPHHTHLIGTIIEQRTQGIPAQAHLRPQAPIVYADHDATQDTCQKEQWRYEETRQQEGQRVIAGQMAGQEVCICKMTAQRCFENGEKADRNSLCSHFLQAFTSTEKGEEQGKQQKERGSETLSRATLTPERPQGIAPTRTPC